MEEWVANLLTQVPLAIAVLLIWYLMDIQQGKAEANRETNRAADNAAQNKTVETLLQTAVSYSQSVSTLARKVDSLVDHTAAVQDSIDAGFFSQTESLSSAIESTSADHGNIIERVGQMDTKIDDLILAIAEIQTQMTEVQTRVTNLCETDSKNEAAMQQILVELAALNSLMTQLVTALTTKKNAGASTTDE